MTSVIVVRYDEIGLKGKNRNFFIDCLVKNIKRKTFGLQISRIRAPRGRIFIDLADSAIEECLARLRDIPGIASFSLGVSAKPDFEQIAELGIQWIKPLINPGATFKFCVRTQRSNKAFHKTSPECNFEIGSRIMRRLAEKGLQVDIKGSQFILEVEIGFEETIVFHHRNRG